MNTRKVFAVLALALPLTAQAEFDYTYIEGGYLRLEPDRINDSGDGVGIRGSAAISDNIFILGEYNSAEFDIGPFDADVDEWAVGLGLHAPLSDRVDVVGSASWVNVDVENFFDDDGFRLDVGLRGDVAPSFELDGGIRYTDVGDDDETTGYLRGLFGPNNLKLLVELEAGDDGEAYLIGGRYEF